MPTATTTSRDFGPLGTVILWLLGLGLGVATAMFVHWDGVFGLRQQLSMLGPNPLLVNDIPFLFTLALIGLVGALCLFLGWAMKVGSFDRPLLALLAFSLNADVVPAIFQLTLFGMVLLLVSRGMRHGDIPIHFSILVIPILLVIVSYATSMLNTTSPFGVTTNMAYRITYLMLVLVLPCVLRTRRQFEIFIHYLIVAALIAVAAELTELVLSSMAGRPITFLEGKYAKISTPYGAVPRLTGLMYHSNHQSNLMGSEAIMALWIGTRPRHMISAGQRVFFLTAYVLMVVAVFLTWSRSGWLCIGVATLLVPAARWPRFSPFYLGGLAIVGAFAYTSGLAERLYQFVHDLNASSADFRWHIDDIAMQAFLFRPWIGIGVGMSVDFYNPYQLQVHDTYREILSEMGIFGCIAFALLFGTVFIRLFRVALFGRHAIDRDWAWALVFAFVITLIQSSFAMFLWIKFMWGMVAMMEALILISKHQTGVEEPDDLLILKPPVRRAVATASPAPA